MPDWKPPIKRELRTERMVVLLTDTENDNLKANAEALDITVADYVRAVLNSRKALETPVSPAEVEGALDGAQALHGPEPESELGDDLDGVLEALSSVDGA